MTDKEKEAIVKAVYPDLSGTDLAWATYLVQDGDTVATYKKRVPEAPKVLKGEVFTPKDIVRGGKAVAGLVKSVFTKKGTAGAAEKVATKGNFKGKTADEISDAVQKSFGWDKKTADGYAADELAGVTGAAAKAAKKWSLKKKAAVGAGVLGVGQIGSSLMNSQGKTPDVTSDPTQSQAEADFANAVATANAAGTDVTQFLQGDAAKQLGLGANNIQDFMAAKGYTNPLAGLNGVGVYTGKEETFSVPRRKYGGTLTGTKSEIVGLSDWNKSFPADAAGIAAAKQKFVTAGVLAPTADLMDVKAAWEKYGQLSLDYSRAGNKLSPWQLLDIQKGLTGSGSQTTTTIDDSPMAKADITTLLKRQLGASLGLTNIDDAIINKFIADVRKKEAKNPSKTVRTTTGNTTRVKSTPGYGQSDVLADAEAYAKQDPRYAEFQTADVFGNALVKALGLKS
jgi:hypothetical protein